MSDLYESIFDNFSFHSDLVFSGNYCGTHLSYVDHRTGFIHFVRSGAAEILIPGRVPIQVTRPSLVFFPRPHTHCMRALDADGVDLVCAQINFNVTFHNPLALSFPDVLVVELKELSSINAVLKVFFLEATSENFGRKKIAESLCVALLIYLSRHLVESGAIKIGALFALGDKKMSKALELIHKKFADKLKLEELAQAVGMSRSRFAELFRQTLGQTPFEYLACYRMGVAQKLLLSKRPVNLVAADVGYESTSAFLRKFKEVVGSTPGSWSHQSHIKADASTTI